MNSDFYAYLEKMIKNQKFPHAFLIESKESEQIIDKIYKILYENNIVSSEKKEKNLSLMIISPEKNLIDNQAILYLQSRFITKSFDSMYKVYFIQNAELMNRQACNKLLKFLEEPSENIIGFLITSDLNKIIPTIKSRCEIFKVHGNDNIDEDIKAIAEVFYSKIEDYKTNLNDLFLFVKEYSKEEKNKVISIISYLQKIYEKEILIADNYQIIANKYKILDNVIDALDANANIELTLDKMCIELRK